MGLFENVTKLNQGTHIFSEIYVSELFSHMPSNVSLNIRNIILTALQGLELTGDGGGIFYWGYPKNYELEYSLYLTRLGMGAGAFSASP